MKNLINIFILSLSLFILGCGGSKGSVSSTSNKQGIKFVKSDKLVKVLDQASSENKLVFVDFYASWCMPCKMMEQDVFTDKELGNYFNENFISYKVNAEKGNGVNLAYLYEVIAYPTLLFLDEKGNVLERKQGAAYHTELKRLAENALMTKNSQSKK